MTFTLSVDMRTYWVQAKLCLPTEATLGTARPSHVGVGLGDCQIPGFSCHGLGTVWKRLKCYLLLSVAILAQYPEHPWPRGSEFMALCSFLSAWQHLALHCSSPGQKGFSVFIYLFGFSVFRVCEVLLNCVSPSPSSPGSATQHVLSNCLYNRGIGSV